MRKRVSALRCGVFRYMQMMKEFKDQGAGLNSKTRYLKVPRLTVVVEACQPN